MNADDFSEYLADYQRFLKMTYDKLPLYEKIYIRTQQEKIYLLSKTYKEVLSIQQSYLILSRMFLIVAFITTCFYRP